MKDMEMEVPVSLLLKNLQLWSFSSEIWIPQLLMFADFSQTQPLSIESYKNYLGFMIPILVLWSLHHRAPAADP